MLFGRKLARTLNNTTFPLRIFQGVCSSSGHVTREGMEQKNKMKDRRFNDVYRVFRSIIINDR